MRLLGFSLVAALVQGYNVGFSVTDITPNAKELASHKVFLGGYGELGDRGGNVGFARGVHDPVWARAAAIDDFDETDVTSSKVIHSLRKRSHGSGVNSSSTTPGQTLLILAVIDGIGMGNILMNHIRGNVTALEPRINSDNILISITHSHSSPDFQGLWMGVYQDYRDRVVLAAAHTIVDAFNKRVPARLFASAGVGYNHNRRDWGWAQNVSTIVEARGKNGTRLGAICQFTAHPTVLGADNLNVSSDWVGYFRSTAEATLGVPVLYFNGPIGDVSPAPKNGSGFTAAESYGSDLATITLASMANQTEVTGQIYLSTVHFNQTVTNLKFIIAGTLTPLLNNYYQWLPLNRTAILFPSQTSYFHFGKVVQGLAFPGESLTRNAEPILEHMKAPFHLFLGLSGDTLGYFVPSDEWEDGRHKGYEESVSTNRFAGDNELARMLDMIAKDPFPPSVK